MMTFNTWFVPILICCLLILWVGMEIRDKRRKNTQEAQREFEIRSFRQQIHILGLRCDALSKAIQIGITTKTPQGSEFTCPDCGSHHYVKGTAGDGYCHGYVDGGKKACGFSWDKVDDHLYFTLESASINDSGRRTETPTASCVAVVRRGE